MRTEKISIIMPVLNEAKILGRTLSRLYLSEHEELVVVDGGSSDETVTIAREFTRKVLTAKTGRASVMNFGAQRAEGDIFLFLHADCALPERGFSIIREVLGDMSVAAGAFLLRIDHPGARYRVIEAGTNIRSRLTSLLYGDQGMFLRKDTFQRIGGFADIPLMEDIEISRRLRREGRIMIVRHPILSSPRRWLDEGVIHTTLRDWTIAFLYTFMNVSPSRLLRYYRDVR
jgi:rSAM/selenodomain-associated transferase 2